MTPDRVESKKVERILLILKIVMVIIAALVAFIVITTRGQVEFEIVRPFVLASILVIPTILKFNRMKGQFIEWRNDSISFKAKTVQADLDLEEIEEIDIALDNVIIKTISGISYDLSLSYFSDFALRKRIKNNFIGLEKSLKERI